MPTTNLSPERNGRARTGYGHRRHLSFWNTICRRAYDVGMKIAKCLLPAALFFLYAALPAHANDLSLFGGTQNPGSLTLRTVTTGALVSPRTFGVFGIRFSQGHIVGSEHTFAYSPNFLSTQHSAIIYHSNLLVQAPLPVFQPYASAGLGTIWVRGSGLQAVTGAKFAFNYGGGVKLKFAGPLVAQIDARGYSVHGINAQTLNVVEVSVGILFSF